MIESHRGPSWPELVGPYRSLPLIYEEYWIEVNRLENQGDRIYRRIVANLFSGSYKSLEVLKLKDIVDSLEHAIDSLESVANTVEQIAVKES